MKTRFLVCMCALVLAAATLWAQTPESTAWSTPQNLGGPVNSLRADTHPVISKDGLELYFSADKNRLPNYGGRDIWVAERSSESDPWDTPQNLGPAISTSAIDENPAVSPDGHRLYFGSNRSGNFDIYVSRRHNKRTQLWQEPERLGDGVNTGFDETSPAFFEDETTGQIYLYFVSNRSGNYDIYVSQLLPDETFGPAQPVPNVNTPFDEDGPFVSRDGLELFFNSGRTDSAFTPGNIWVSRRASTGEDWPAATEVTEVNTAGNEVGPALSWDGTQLYFGCAFCSGNVGGSLLYDIWKAERPKPNEADE